MMDRHCEFCVNLRSVVYCNADAAYLCLSCDTKVHAANPLSKRHHRTLICNVCGHHPSYVRCYDHQKFMCRGCDLRQHTPCSQHVKRVMNSYAGCPSARDLGALWGFDLTRFGSDSCASSDTSVHIKEASILEQLVDMLRVQTSSKVVDLISLVIRCEEHKVDQYEVDQSAQQFWLGEGHPDRHEMIMDPSSSPFTQFDHLESETDETDLQGDPFWQFKSRVLSGQLWSQNMQDLGVCEEPSCFDDLDIPDIDLTFRNFEEIELDPKGVDQDKSMTTCLNNSESCPKKAHYASQIMPFSDSRFSAESNGTKRIDSGTSSSCQTLADLESAELEGEKNIKGEDSKQGESGYRKARSDARKRTKSQSWKFERHGQSFTKS